MTFVFLLGHLCIKYGRDCQKPIQLDGDKWPFTPCPGTRGSNQIISRPFTNFDHHLVHTGNTWIIRTIWTILCVQYESKHEVGLNFDSVDS